MFVDCGVLTEWREFMLGDVLSESGQRVQCEVLRDSGQAVE